MRYCTRCKGHCERFVMDADWQPVCPLCGARVWSTASKMPDPFIVYSKSPERSRRLLEVAERDLWVCHLCNRPVDPGIAGGAQGAAQHPMEATLDHVQPASLGGTRDIDNLRLAHRCCNNLRGNRPVAAIFAS